MFLVCWLVGLLLFFSHLIKYCVNELEYHHEWPDQFEGTMLNLFYFRDDLYKGEYIFGAGSGLGHKSYGISMSVTLLRLNQQIEDVCITVV